MKPQCPQQWEVSAFLDGELDGGAAARLEAHLAICDRCRSALRALKAVDRQIANLPGLSVSSSFDSDFRERLETLTQGPGWRERLKPLLSGWRPLWAAGAAACLAALIFLYHGDQRPALSPEEIVMVEHMELFQEFELIEKLEFLESWDGLQDGAEPT
jgi:anti-sigma factor RsiW